MLTILGRRIERLLYVGSLLLVVCFVELYLVVASLDVAGTRVGAIDAMLARIAENKAHLSTLFVSQKEDTSKLAQEDKQVSATRKALGLAPGSRQPSSDRSYQLELSHLAITVAIDNSLDVDDFRSLIDMSAAPDELTKGLEAQKKALLQQSASVWGIEAPRTLSFEYGGSSYRVPSRFIAWTLLVALVPLIIAWLGSVYATRQRELLKICQLEDYKLAFPHILNLLPVILPQARLEQRFRTRKQLRSAKTFNRRILAVFRSLVVLMISLPMLTVVYYCGFRLILALGVMSEVAFPIVIVALVGGVTLLAQTLQLVWQECVLLAGKEFYA